MRSFLVALFLTFAAAASVSAQERDWGSADANRYWPLKQERIEAYRTRDRARMERVLAPSFIGLGPDGRRVTRDEYLAAEFSGESGEAPEVNTEVSDFTATRTGSTLVLSYRETEHVNVAGQAFDTPLARLDVYVRQGGHWRLQTMTAVRLPQAPRAIEVSAERLADYVGTYEYGPGVQSVIRLSNGHLLEQSTGSPEVEMIPISPDEFYSPPDLESRVIFERDATGRVVTQVYRSGAQVLRARRVE
jgi:hypothetical protein